MEVFWRQGFEGASCDELLQAMGINCGSMYSTFGDKQALFDRAFKHYEQTVVLASRELLDGEGSPLENVSALVEKWGQMAASGRVRGCLVTNTLVELGPTGHPLARRATRILGQIQELIEKKLRAAKRSGELPADKSPKALAAFLINTAQGLAVMSQAGQDASTIRGVVRTTLSVLR